MGALDDGTAAANLLSVDFEKTFNRMDHHECLIALKNLGASKTSVAWTSAFLFGRTMSVRIRGNNSVPRTVPGGSPQGSILGNFLFCSTTDQFANINAELVTTPDSDAVWSSSDSSAEFAASALPLTPTTAISTPSARGQFASFRPPECLLNLSGDYQSDEEDLSLIHI